MNNSHVLKQKKTTLPTAFLLVIILYVKQQIKQQNNFALVVFSLFFILAISQVFSWQTTKKIEKAQTITYVNSPKIDDLYFLDFRLMSNTLRPKEKFRLAKVVDITGDVVTLLYGDFYYAYHNQIKDSIRYGHLRFKDYFQSKRYNFNLSELKTMHDSGAIYLIKRPLFNQLDGNHIGPLKTPTTNNIFIPGKSENNSGEAFLFSKNVENNLENAFLYFQQSADLGYAKGQVNLAELYLHDQPGKKDLLKSLFWLKQAAKQSNKPAILKYVIVCKQVALCSEYDFYQELINAGVNIKVRNIDFTLH